LTAEESRLFLWKVLSLKEADNRLFGGDQVQLWDSEVLTPFEWLVRAQFVVFATLECSLYPNPIQVVVVTIAKLDSYPSPTLTILL